MGTKAQLRGTARPRWRPFPIWWLAFSYFAAYLLYAGLVRLLPAAGWHWPSLFSGFAVACVPGLLLLSSRLRKTGNQDWPLLTGGAAFALALSGIATSLIAVTTLLIVGSSALDVLSALVLMRGGVLLLGPVWDRIVGRKPSRTEWSALGLCLVAISLPLMSGGGFSALGATAGPLALYLIGYVTRIGAMSRHAKRSEPALRAVWLCGEIVTCLVVMAPALLVASWLAIPPTSTFSFPQAVIGGAYGVVLLFGSLIYLDPGDNSRAIPVNRASSLLAGLVLAIILHLLGQSEQSPTWAALAGGAMLTSALWLLYRESDPGSLTR